MPRRFHANQGGAGTLAKPQHRPPLNPLDARIPHLDRLGRSIQGLIALAADLSARKVDFRSLTDGFDTSTASGRLLFHILASVAEMERELIKERTIAGLAAARKKGGTGSGRKSALTPDKLDTARKLLAAGDTPAKVAKLLQVGLSTFYRHFPASEREVRSSFA